MDDDALLDNVLKVGKRLRDGARRAGVQAVQGRGLLLGLRLDRPAAEVQRALFGHRILTGTSTDSAVLRLMPPLSFTSAEADQLIAALVEVLA
jgi:acetylornithine/succinyldiaminopimelate/putrescine aminotransferase